MRLRGGGELKIAFASTDEQDEEINQLILNLRSNVLVQYISREELEIYDDLGLLQFASNRNLYNGTLREAFQLMTALQVVTDIIDRVANTTLVLEEKYNQIFALNVEKINYYGLFFPFNLQFFHSDKEGLNSDKRVLTERMM